MRSLPAFHEHATEGPMPAASAHSAPLTLEELLDHEIQNFTEDALTALPTPSPKSRRVDFAPGAQEWSTYPTPTHRVTYRPGDVVIIDLKDGHSYGAVLVKIEGGVIAHLTFTPRGAPEQVSIGQIACKTRNSRATLDPRLIPRYQPEESPESE